MKCFLVAFVICLLTGVNAACVLRDPYVYKQVPGCPKYDVSSGVVTCPVSCPNLCSRTGTSTLCSCGAPSCSCIKDTDNVCAACAPKPSPMCSCLANLDLDCDCATKKSFVYYPEVQYPLTAIEMNPFYYSTCFDY